MTLSDGAAVRAASDDRLYFEDLSVAQVFRAGPKAVTAEDVKAYAARFDPQPFHVDEERAVDTFFGGLAASGWHTASITMSLLIEAVPFAGGLVGSGVDELRWPRPLRPDDDLRVQAEVVELRPSRSRPSVGLARLKVTTFNRAGEPVQTMFPNLIVPRRPPAAIP
jgi:acyl dehydratase